MKLINSAYLMKIIREIDLGQIQREAQKHFTLLLLGDEHLITPLAEALSAGDETTGIHPWLELAPQDPPQELQRFGLVLLVQSDIDPGPETQARLRRLKEAGVPVLTVVVNKDAAGVTGADLPRPYEGTRLLLEAPTPADGLKATLAPALLQAAPEGMRLALTRQLPLLRPAFSRGLIEETARANALYSASTGLGSIIPVLNIPLNVADTIVLTKNQLVMAYKLALAGGKEGRPLELMGEIVSVLGGGMLFRQVARELVGLIPVIGIIPNIAVSYAGTRVIGHAVHLWVSEGQKLELDDVRRTYDRALAAGKQLAESLVKQGRVLHRRNRHGPKGGPRALPDSDDEDSKGLPETTGRKET